MNKKSLEGYKIIFGYLGIFLIFTGVINLIPLLMLIFFPEEYTQAWHFLIPGIGSIGLGLLLYQFIKGKTNITTLKNQDAIIVTISWILCMFISAIPYTFEYSFSQSVFETTSALSTTGFSILNLESLSKILTFHRVILSFVGGIGVMLIMLVFLRDKRGMRLYSSEGHNDKLLPNLINSSKAILKIYCGYIIGGIILYIILGMNWFDSICHSVNAVATSGFSNKVGSIGYYDNIGIEIVTIILMLLGSINFLVQFLLIKGKWKNFFKYCETKAMTVIYAIFIPIIAFLLFKTADLSLSQSFRSAAFHTISAMTSTGFSIMNTNIPALSGSIILLLIILMLIGGGASSTSGGIKVYRIHLMIKDFFWNIKDKFISKNVVSLHFVQKAEETVAVDNEERDSVKFFILLYLFVAIVLTLLLSLYGYDVLSCLFDVISSMGNIGFSMGIFNPLSPNGVLWISTIAMLLGRLEIIVVMMAIVQIGKKIKDTIQYKKN